MTPSNRRYGHPNNRVVPDVVIGDMQATAPIYHRIDYSKTNPGYTKGFTACGLVDWTSDYGWRMDLIPTRHAAKFARPCKKCWPELWTVAAATRTNFPNVATEGGPSRGSNAGVRATTGNNRTTTTEYGGSATSVATPTNRQATT